MKPIKIEGTQKDRVIRLNKQLEKAVKTNDLKSAKVIVRDLQDIYTRYLNEAKIFQSKIRLFEIAINVKEYQFAEKGLLIIKGRVNYETRMYLEATALLAICYIRWGKLEKAEPMINDVLTNDDVIKSADKRIEFRREIIQRFDEEAALYSIINQETNDIINNEELGLTAQNLAQSSTEEGIYDIIGKNVPEFTKQLLFRVDEFSKNRLPSAERKKLPSPKETIEDKKVGKTIFSVAKRVLYNSLCDKESDIYKMLFTNGLNKFFSVSAMVGVISSTLINTGIRMVVIITSVAALVIKFGIEVYCEMNKPKDIMGIR